MLTYDRNLKMGTRRHDLRNGGRLGRTWMRRPVVAPIGAALIAITLLSAFAYVSVGASRGSVLRDAAVQVRSNRDAAVRALSIQAEGYERTVAAYALNPQIVASLASRTPAARAKAQDELATLADSSDSPSAFISDAHGVALQAYPPERGLVGKRLGSREMVQGVQRTGAPYVSGGYRSVTAGHPLVVSVTAPVLSGGRRLGYVTVLWQLESVRLIADASHHDDRVSIAVTDQLGQALNGAPTTDSRGEPRPAPVSALTRQALGGRSADAHANGQLQAVAPVPGLGWTVTATMPRSVALAAADRFQRSLELALGISLVMVALLTGFATREARSRARDHRLVALERERLATLFGASPIGILECLADGTIVTVNDALAVMLDYEPAELIGRRGSDLLAPDALPAAEADARQLLAGRLTSYSRNRFYVARTGGHIPAFASVIVLPDRDGRAQHVVAFIVDQRGPRRAEQALRSSEERLRRVFDEGLIGKLLVDPSGDILRVNATFARLLGTKPAALIGSALAEQFSNATDQRTITEFLARADGKMHAEMAMTAPGGRQVCALVALTWLTETDGQQVLLAQVQDITARRAAEQRLTELALHDELTGLPNRRLLLERCERAFTIARSHRGASSSLALLFIDLDGFKPINDRQGHETGDKLLIEIAQDLKTVLRPSDTVARIGGDEFVVLVEQDSGLAHLRALGDRITGVVRRQVAAGDTALTVTASVGIARVDLAHEPDVTPDQLLRRADAAMYRAKERGRDRHDVFDTELLDAGETRLLLEQAVRDGLRDDRVSLVFQPVVDLDTQTVLGAEALLRLTAADGRLLPTLPAIVAAEAAGLTEALGDRVLHLALTAAREWPETMTVAVNISARELTGRDLRTRVEQALRRHSFDPGRLVLEITESSILTAGPSALAELTLLRRRGVKVAIDDFGTAYATLANLTALPVDALKVDASFTAGLPTERTHAAVVHAIASMARELGIPCIVEGVETTGQLEALTGLGVRAQGWLWGAPRGPEHIPAVSHVISPERVGALPEHYPADGRDPRTSSQ